jgi:hypothetical protein
MTCRIVAVSDRPKLAPMVATWLLDEFRHPGSPTHEVLTARILAPRVGAEETFVLFDWTSRSRPQASRARISIPGLI